MTLREIAERWKRHEGYCQGNHAHMECRPQHQEDIAALLNAVVEERAELIARSDENIEITLRQAKKKALRGLGLEGVWPIKGE